MGDTALIDRVRKLCLALPEAFEIEAWEHPTFRVGSGRGKMFCIAADDGSSIRVKADPIEREALLEQGDPFYMPAYVGTKGWIGVQLDDVRTDWEELAELIATSYCLIAPKRLAERVTSPPSLGG
ncbi:MAG TPA: MmcQ/YjbR family DNA-binding protein [Solirubrobacterales bacterium]|nr:MmcQ/YjbR family DNA-binding protein [Solirubrobacterales bacterium]